MLPYNKDLVQRQKYIEQLFQEIIKSNHHNNDPVFLCTIIIYSVWEYVVIIMMYENSGIFLDFLTTGM